MKKTQCKLLIHKTVIGEDRLPVIENIEKLVPCENKGTFSVKYYNDQSRSMRTSVNIGIPRAFLTFGEIWRVEYNGVLYDVKNDLADKQRGSRYIILDCDEVKTKI